jgi:hypothetical protein
VHHLPVEDTEQRRSVSALLDQPVAEPEVAVHEGDIVRLRQAAAQPRERVRQQRRRRKARARDAPPSARGPAAALLAGGAQELEARHASRAAAPAPRRLSERLTLGSVKAAPLAPAVGNGIARSRPHQKGPQHAGVVAEPRRRRREHARSREAVQHPELRLEVVGLEQSGRRLSLGDVAAKPAAQLGVERERLLREALGVSLEMTHLHRCAESLGQEVREIGFELEVGHAEAAV